MSNETNETEIQRQAKAIAGEIMQKGQEAQKPQPINCGNCQYSHEGDGIEIGKTNDTPFTECRRYAPKPGDAGSDEQGGQGLWPTVPRNEVCGEHSSIERRKIQQQCQLLAFNLGNVTIQVLQQLGAGGQGGNAGAGQDQGAETEQPAPAPQQPGTGDPQSVS